MLVINVIYFIQTNGNDITSMERSQDQNKPSMSYELIVCLFVYIRCLRT